MPEALRSLRLRLVTVLQARRRLLPPLVLGGTWRLLAFWVGLLAGGGWLLLPVGAASQAAASAPDAAFAQAQELQRLGQLEEAAARWREAVRGYREEGRAREERLARIRLSLAQQALGHYRAAVDTALAALPSAEADGDAEHVAAIHGSVGNAYVALGPAQRAREHMDRALEIARQADLADMSAAVQVNLGNLHAAQGASQEALAAYESAASAAARAGRGDLRARALANAARLGERAAARARAASAQEARAAERPGPEAPRAQAQADAARLAEEARRAEALARRQLEQAAPLARALPDSHEKAYLLINLGRTSARLVEAAPSPARNGLMARTHELLTEASAVAERLGDGRAGSYATGYLGELYEKAGRLDESLPLTRRALFLAQEAGAPESLYRWHWQLGRVLKAKGKLGEATLAYQQAVEVLQGIRYEMENRYASDESSFREAVGPVFFELVDLLLRADPSGKTLADTQQRLLEARDTVERLKAAELRDYFRDECVDAVEAQVESLDQVSTTAVVIYPILLEDRLELLLTLPGGMRRETVAQGAAAVTEEVRELRRLLEKRQTRQYLPHAQRLYDWLVRPVEPHLAGGAVDTLVFVPDGPLRTIPMAALHDGSQFLVDRFAVATTPGLSLTDPRPLDRSQLKLFLGGVSEARAGFAPLEHVPAELGAIQALHGGRVLLDADFRLPRVEETLTDRDFNIVHIASHGEFSGDVDQSFVLTWDGRLTMDRLSEYVGLFRFRDTPIELLALSACETAQGDDRAALGLAGVAIKAGARSALGTLWSVQSEATAELMVEFYRQLEDEGLSKAAALRAAQRHLRQANTSYAHPYYWSPFLLISNWL